MLTPAFRVGLLQAADEMPAAYAWLMPPRKHFRVTDRPADWADKNQPLVVLYEALTARVGHRDALLWQSPALALAAQAFLLTIALGHDSGPVARLIAAGLGLVVTRMSIQLMLKHQMYLNNDQVMMVALEREMGLPTSAIDYKTQLTRIREDKTTPPLRKPMVKDGLTAKVSVDVWILGLRIIAVINILLMVFAFLDMIGVPCPNLPVFIGEARCWVEL